MSNQEPYDMQRQSFVRGSSGLYPDGLKLLDAGSDDDFVLETIRNHRPEMRFRLVYDGPLPSAAGHRKLESQWAIRRSLEPQLAELWTFKPALLGETDSGIAFVETATSIDTISASNEGIRLRPIERGPSRYLPIVRKEMMLTCTLDILFLRKDGPGDIVSNAGDLDNRIKVLFDGLRVPDMSQGMPDGLVADPFHVLLEDDKLITSFSIRTDRLLHRPDESRDTVLLVIDVIISPTRVRTELNAGYTWD